MRPHITFSDDVYTEHLHREQTVMDYVRGSDCLIIIGANMSSTLVKKIVCEFLDQDQPVIEINSSESAINRGKNIQVISDQKLDTVVAELFQEYYRIISQNIEENKTEQESGTA